MRNAGFHLGMFAVFVSSLIVALNCNSAPINKPSSLAGPTQATASAAKGSDPVRVGAGDIASCDDLGGAEATAKLIDNIPGTVFAVGDLAYPDGSDEQFAKCYGPTWGRFKERTRPAPGNHEYRQGGASGYARYFGAIAGEPSKAYYSYDLGAWHIIVLNSECAAVGGCEATSPQGRWLHKDLAQHPVNCTLAYFHIPCSVRAQNTAMMRK